jgi:hypothetical protein
MEKTIKHEVRAEDGAFRLWRVVESQVPGEGGSECLGEITRQQATGNLLAVEEQITTLNAQTAQAREQRAFWLNTLNGIAAAEESAG